ncbi:MAG: hypothetical protein AAB443_01600 [Patescibacteria group bacterium]
MSHLKSELLGLMVLALVLTGCWRKDDTYQTPEAEAQITYVSLGTDGSALYAYEAEEDGVMVVRHGSILFEDWSKSLMALIPSGTEYPPGTFLQSEGSVTFQIEEERVNNLPENYRVDVYTMTSYLVVSFHREGTLIPNCGFVDSASWFFRLEDPNSPHFKYAGYNHAGGGTVGVDISSYKGEVYENPCEDVNIPPTTEFPVRSEE